MHRRANRKSLRAEGTPVARVCEGRLAALWASKVYVFCSTQVKTGQRHVIEKQGLSIDTRGDKGL